jgi:hypothetical protein
MTYAPTPPDDLVDDLVVANPSPSCRRQLPVAEQPLTRRFTGSALA